MKARVLLKIGLLVSAVAGAHAGAISGTVEDMGGAPLEDATISVNESSNCQDQSGPDGAYMVAPDAKYRHVTLIYRKPGYVTRVKADVENKNQKCNPVRLTLRTELDKLSRSDLRELRSELVKIEQGLVVGALRHEASKDLKKVDALARDKFKTEMMAGTPPPNKDQ